MFNVIFSSSSFIQKTSYVFDNGSWPNSEVEPYGEDSPDPLSSFSICLVGKFKEKKIGNLIIMEKRAYILQSCCSTSIPQHTKFLWIFCLNFLISNYVSLSLSLFHSLNSIYVLFLGTVLAVLIFLSVAGNILVCVAIYTERSLRRIGNLFLASLAIADLFVASLVMTFAGVNDILGMDIKHTPITLLIGYIYLNSIIFVSVIFNITLGYWIFGAKFCDTWVAFDVMCSTASILNLCAISLDRYIHIKDPLR